MSTATRSFPTLPANQATMLYRGYVKRALDVLIVFLAAPAFLPVILLLVLLTKRDGGPAFFGHERIGRNGRTFRCWKIRTMVPNAAEVLERHLAQNPAAAAEWERDFKLTHDPRVTPLGRLLRQTSLDELPQLWNVLVGEMSLVGPRPVTRPELVRYRGAQGHYLSAKPGITGLWQVSGRNDISYDERVRLDVAYAELCSFAADMGILFRTVATVLRRTGR